MLDDDPGLVGEVASWLMGRDEIGMVFARDALVPELPGTLPLSAVNLEHSRAADLVYVARSSDAPDAHGLPGSGQFTGGVPVGGGMHGGLNRYELNTVLMIAAGGLGGGVVDTRPCGLIDIAPTILDLLGCSSGAMDGGSLVAEPPTDGRPEPESHSAGHGDFRQSLSLWRRGRATFIREGGRC